MSEVCCGFCDKIIDEGKFYYRMVNQEKDGGIYHKSCVTNVPTLVGHVSKAVKATDYKIRKKHHKSKHRRGGRVSRSNSSFSSQIDPVEQLEQDRIFCQIILYYVS